jgi:hypothetical protein
MDLNNDDAIRDKMVAELWVTQVLPKFTAAGLGAPQINAAKKMFIAGFEAGWESHKAHLVKQFIAENQKQKVHLA